MSKIMGDALVGGPESTNAPEIVTVRMSKADLDLLWFAANLTGAEWVVSGLREEAAKLRPILIDLRVQIGGSR